jgi:hypothetical protein
MTKQLRNGKKFGLTMAAVSTVFMLLMIYKQNTVTSIILASIAFIFFLMAMVAPKALEPVEKVWMAFAFFLGNINTKIIMGIMYFFVITPLALIFKLTGRDTMRRRLMVDKQSGWEDYRSRQQDEKHYENMF